MKALFSGLALSIGCALHGDGGPRINAQTLSVRLPQASAEFIVTQPIDRAAIADGWIYLLRYVHHEPENAISFSLTLTKCDGGRQYRIMLHEGLTMPYSEFDKMPETRKLALASASQYVRSDLAQSIYETWVKALLRTRYGDDISNSTGEKYFYLSSYSHETGYMAGISPEQIPGTTTGKIGRLGLLMRDFARENDADRRDEIAKTIAAACASAF